MRFFLSGQNGTSKDQECREGACGEGAEYVLFLCRIAERAFAAARAFLMPLQSSQPAQSDVWLIRYHYSYTITVMWLLQEASAGVVVFERYWGRWCLEPWTSVNYAEVFVATVALRCSPFTPASRMRGGGRRVWYVTFD